MKGQMPKKVFTIEVTKKSKEETDAIIKKMKREMMKNEDKVDNSN